MRRHAIRLICILISFSCCLGCISCGVKQEEEAYDPSIKFGIVQQSITYTDEFIDDANQRFTKIALEILKSYYATELTDAQKQKVDAQFKKNVIPVCLRARVYEDELKTILFELERMIESKTQSGEELIIFEVYESLLYSVGSQKTGKIIFELSKVFIDYKAKDAHTKYEKYGYQWHLDNAKRYEELLNSVLGMGSEKFSALASMASVIASTALHIPEFEKDASAALSGDHFLLVLESHGAYFLDLNITEEDAEIFGSIVSELLPTHTSSLSGAHLYALKKTGYFSVAAKILPSFINLYSSFTLALSKNGEFDFEDSTSNQAKTLIRALLDCEEELVVFLAAVDTYAASNTTDELNAIKEQGYLLDATRFIEETVLCDNEELIASLRAFTLSDASNIKPITDAIISRLIAVAPYIVFTFTR